MEIINALENVAEGLAAVMQQFGELIGELKSTESIAQKNRQKIIQLNTKFIKETASEVLPRESIERAQIPHIDNVIEEIPKQENKQLSAFLKFTEKEILRMPKKIRKEFRVEGCTARITERKSGKYGTCYEIRYRRNGYNVTASSTNLQEAKEKFIEKLHLADKGISNDIKVPTVFDEFIMYFFDNYHIKKASELTCKKHKSQYSMHIKPFLGILDIRRITPKHCEMVLDKILQDGKGRLCEEVYSILNQTFKYAIEHQLITRNPLGVLVYDKHEREPGVAISKQDEKTLITNIADNCRLPIALLLYAGLRVNELYTVRIEGDFVIANNSKRKRNQRKEEKRIAISPMLRPYLSNPIDIAKFPLSSNLLEKLKEILPDHTLKDCRTTFSTRAQECGVNRTVIKLFMGHKPNDVLGQHYTNFSDDFLIAEAQKIKY